MTQCKECGNKLDLHYGEETNNLLLSKKLCFTCEYFANVLTRYINGNLGDDKLTIVDEKYHVFVLCRTPNNAPNHFLGYNGQQFYFQHNQTGTLITCGNVWDNGTVPQHYRNRLKPTCTQLYKEEFDTLKKNHKVLSI